MEENKERTPNNELNNTIHEILENIESMEKIILDVKDKSQDEFAIISDNISNDNFFDDENNFEFENGKSFNDEDNDINYNINNIENYDDENNISGFDDNDLDSENFESFNDLINSNFSKTSYDSQNEDIEELRNRNIDETEESFYGDIEDTEELSYRDIEDTEELVAEEIKENKQLYDDNLEDDENEIVSEEDFDEDDDIVASLSKFFSKEIVDSVIAEVDAEMNSESSEEFEDIDDVDDGTEDDYIYSTDLYNETIKSDSSLTKEDTNDLEEFESEKENLENDDNLESFVVDDDLINEIFGVEESAGISILDDGEITSSQEDSLNEPQKDENLLVENTNDSVQNDDDFTQNLDNADSENIEDLIEEENEKTAKLDDEKQENISKDDNLTDENENINDNFVENKQEVNEEITINYLLSRGNDSFVYESDTINEALTFENESKNETTSVSEEETIEFLSHSSEIGFVYESSVGEIENQSYTISEDDTLSYFTEEKIQEIASNPPLVCLGGYSNKQTDSHDNQDESSANENSLNEQSDTNENLTNQEQVIDGLYVPENEIYLRQSKQESRVKLYYYASKIFGICMLFSLVFSIISGSVIVLKENVATSGMLNHKNFGIALALFIIFTILHKFIGDRFYKRSYKVYKMLKDCKGYKPLGNYQSGERFDSRVKTTKEYLIVDLAIFILTLLAVLTLFIPFVEVSGQKISLFNCSIDGIKKFISFEFSQLSKVMGFKSPDKVKDASVVFISGPISLLYSFISSHFSSLSANKILLLCALICFLIFIFAISMIIICANNIYKHIFGILNVKNRIVEQKIPYKNSEFRDNTLLNLIMKLLLLFFSGLATIISFVGIAIKFYNQIKLLPMILIFALLVLIITLIILRKCLFKDKVSLDSGLWFFDIYRPILRLKYFKAIRDYAKDAPIRNLEEYLREQKRIEEEKLENAEEVKRNRKIKRMTITIIVSAVALVIFYIAAGFMDMLGFFHAGEYKYVYTDSISGVVQEESIILKKNGKLKFDMGVELNEELQNYYDSLTYKIFGINIVFYKDGSIDKNFDQRLCLEDSNLVSNITIYNSGVVETKKIVYERVYSSKFKKTVSKIYSKVRIVLLPVTKVLELMSNSKK